MSERLSLRRRLALLFAVLFVLVLVGGALSGLALSRLVDAQHQQVDRLDPADAASNAAFNGMVDQETGLRGYSLTRDPSFLQPYTTGRPAAATAFDRLRVLVGDDPRLRDDVDRTVAAANVWQSSYADPALRATQATPPGQVPKIDFAAGKARFDAVRTSFDRLNTDLHADRAQARDELHSATNLLVGLVIAALSAIVVVAGLVWLALRRWITDPLGRLSGEIRQVAGGDINHSIVPEGPPDLRAVGADVEHMRRRLVDEYDGAVAARAQVQEAAALLEQQAADLRRSNAELEQFAYVASHDLQEPLRKVTSFCQMLERRYSGQLDERGEQYISFAVDGAKRMQRLINDLLAFSRVGRTTTHFERVDLDELVRDALSDVERVVDDTGGAVNIGPMPVVLGDPSLLRQLFVNLIGNALKFRRDEPPQVTITAERTGETWTFRCRDNGIGIEPQYAERVFVIFQRLHGRDRYEGTGIGLALCRKIVEYHGGTIRVAANDDGPGTTIVWTLPVAEHATPPVDTAEPNPVRVPAPAAGSSVPTT